MKQCLPFKDPYLHLHTDLFKAFLNYLSCLESCLITLIHKYRKTKRLTIFFKKTFITHLPSCLLKKHHCLLRILFKIFYIRIICPGFWRKGTCAWCTISEKNSVNISFLLIEYVRARLTLLSENFGSR